MEMRIGKGSRMCDLFKVLWQGKVKAWIRDD